MQTISPPTPAHPGAPLPQPLRAQPLDEAVDLAACREALANGSRTFLVASLLLPRAVREPACALYAFCRAADDAVDGQGASDDAVARLRQRLTLVYLGCPEPIAADRALASVVARFAIPRALPEALLEGFAWDAAGRRYETMADLQAYAARVAGTVGAMMALLMGVRSAQGVARACDLGVAMQLSNIARDVGEDARMGRLYLPRQWLHEAGIDPDAWLRRPVFDAALASVVKRVLAVADDLYARVDAGVAQLPLACRPGINAARYLYADIGHEVARRGFDSVTQRAVVPAWRKAWLLAWAMLGLWPGSASLSAPEAAPALAATRFLVDAVTAASSSARAAPAVAWWNVKQRVLWVIDLFERLEHRDRGLQRGLN